MFKFVFFFSSRRRHTRWTGDWSSDVCSSDLEPARLAMGDTRRLAERMGLLDMEPRGELSSTEYALASPGTEYVVLEPTESTDPFTLNVAAGSYAAEWYDVTSRETVPAAEVTVPAAEVTVPTAGPVSFRAPYPAAGPAVLRLRR